MLGFRPVAGRGLTWSLISLAALTVATSATAEAGGEGRRPQRPNIVVIVTDDQTQASLRGRFMPKTVARLAGRGTTFRQSIVTTPLCCPSRATLLTGQYAHNHGVISNDDGYPGLRNKRNLLPTWLRRAGYRTAHVGKFLTGYDLGKGVTVPPGWDEWRTMMRPFSYHGFSLNENGQRRRYGSDKYLTHVLTRKAVAVIDRFSGRRAPFYLQVDHWAPHGGEDTRGPCTGSAIPAGRDLGRFADEPLPQPPSLNEEAVADKPSFIQHRPRLTAKEMNRVRLDYRCRLESLAAVDRGVRAIWAALRKAGELGRTVLVFTSDNGFYQGEHRLARGKTVPYEEGVRVPLAVRLPGYLRGKGGGTSDAPVANLDLAPTIIGLARAQPCRGERCRTLDGRSLWPLLRGRQPDWTSERGLLVELDRPETSSPYTSCSYAGIRIPGAAYVEHSSVTGAAGECTDADERELYDLADDPFQLENLLPTLPDNPDALLLEVRLRARLIPLRNCSGIAGRDPAPPRGTYCE